MYVAQSGLADLLKTRSQVTVWDVGLGAAANAMAALNLANEISKGQLLLLSFERDLGSLQLALQHPNLFPYLDRHEPRKLLEHGRTHSTSVSWCLMYGDFAEQADGAPTPDIIFFDPFSLRTDGPMWSWPCIQMLGRRLKARDGVLVTYSVSTAVRAGLLATGLWVAKGEGSGRRRESTIAVGPGNQAVRNWLGTEWIAKWRVSSAQFPFMVTHQDNFSRCVREHPQFNGPSDA